MSRQSTAAVNPAVLAALERIEIERGSPPPLPKIPIEEKPAPAVISPSPSSTTKTAQEPEEITPQPEPSLQAIGPGEKSSPIDSTVLAALQRIEAERLLYPQLPKLPSMETPSTLVSSLPSTPAEAVETHFFRKPGQGLDVDMFPEATTMESNLPMDYPSLALLKAALPLKVDKSITDCSELARLAHPFVAYALLDVLANPNATRRAKETAANFISSLPYNELHQWIAEEGLGLDNDSSRKYCVRALRGKSEKITVDNLVSVTKGDDVWQIRAQAYLTLCANPISDHLEQIGNALKQGYFNEEHPTVRHVIKECRARIDKLSQGQAAA